jgi:hypothetical protein
MERRRRDEQFHIRGRNQHALGVACVERLARLQVAHDHAAVAVAQPLHIQQGVDLGVKRLGVERTQYQKKRKTCTNARHAIEFAQMGRVPAGASESQFRGGYPSTEAQESCPISVSGTILAC